MAVDFTLGFLNLPLACIATEPDLNRVVIVTTDLEKFDVVSQIPLPPVGTWVSMLLIPLDEPNPQPEKDKPLLVKFWDYIE